MKANYYMHMQLPCDWIHINYKYIAQLAQSLQRYCMKFNIFLVQKFDCNSAFTPKKKFTIQKVNLILSFSYCNHFQIILLKTKIPGNSLLC